MNGTRRRQYRKVGSEERYAFVKRQARWSTEAVFECQKTPAIENADQKHERGSRRKTAQELESRR